MVAAPLLDNKSCLVSLVILTWNSVYIKRCVESFANSFAEQEVIAEFIIVDNGSTDETIKIIRDEISKNMPWCCSLTFIGLDENLGTTISRNRGIAEAHGKSIIICDSDTEFVDGNWKQIFQLLSDDESIGIIAPRLSYSDGSVQPSVKKFPTLTDKLRKIPEILFGISIKNTDFYEDFPWDNIRNVDTAISACWIMSRCTVDEVGPLDEKIFYSPEDIDYCLRIWTSGKKVIFYPDMQIIHHTQQITHKKPFSRQSISHFNGLFYYFLKHGYCFSRKKLYKRLGR